MKAEVLRASQDLKNKAHATSAPLSLPTAEQADCTTEHPYLSPTVFGYLSHSDRSIHQDRTNIPRPLQMLCHLTRGKQVSG